VLLATGILLGAAIVLSELAGIGARQASAARDLAQAQLLCQSKLNEIAAGIAPTAATRDAPLAGAPGWRCAVETAPAGRPNMTLVRVTVSQEQPARGRPKTFTLERWVARKLGAGDAVPGTSNRSTVSEPEPQP
jgi:hypothetical protein